MYFFRVRISSSQGIEERWRYFHKLEGSRGVGEMKSFVEVVECSWENLDWFGVSELEGERLVE